jgi:hypothetical protein
MPPTKKTKDGSAAHVDRLQSFVFKKYPGDQQAQLKVKIEVPGKWFGAGEAGALSAGERREKYDAVACEYEEKHVFEAAQARKPAKVGEAIRFLCHVDAADDADSSGYWMPLDIWNRYRNDTYKDRREDEVRAHHRTAARAHRTAARAHARTR